jgi:RNA polymerase sigma factor (sigma-70 family)
MQPTDDGVLLRQYAENHSDEAFAALVARHVNLVYSVALRCVGDPHLAEEVAQAVFIVLAKKAAQLRHDKALSSWLFQTTRLTASNFVRGETRRHRREQEAHVQSVLNDSGSDVWPRIAPMLDDAVAGLNEKERQAIVLRFYEGRNLREIGAALGASEDAAEKRVHRAVEKLRTFFTKRGVTVGASGLVVVIGANAVQAAPAGLAATLTTASLASAAAGTGTTLTLLKFMAMTKLKLTVAAALLAAVLTPVIVWRANEYRLRNVGAATPQCEVDLRNAGEMKDKISNVLYRAEPNPESEVAAFLKDAETRYATGDDLLKAAAEHFKIDQKRLAALVEHWRHINCKHAAIPGYAVPDAAREASTGETLAQEAAPLPPRGPGR